MLTIRPRVDKLANDGFVSVRRPPAHSIPAPTVAPIGHMHTRLVLSITAAGALAFACGPRQSSDFASAALATAVPLRPEMRVSRVGSGGTVKHDTTIQSQFDVRVTPDGVRFILHVQNEGHKQVEIAFPNGQAYDFVVLDPVGREVWRWSRGRLFTQVIQDKLLSAGDDMRLEETWNARAHGKFTAVARLNSTNYPLEQRADFVLP